MIKTELICYLCGNTIIGECSVDHIPPKQLYGTEIRKAHALQLYTTTTHPDCNSAYQKDEDYFVNSLSPTAGDSYSGKSVLKDIQKRVQKDKQKPLAYMVLKEFDRTPSGLILHGKKVLKRFDGSRYQRVIWKIVRGLYYKENAKILPQNTSFTWDIVSSNQKPSEMFFLLSDCTNRGDYPGVFDYRFKQFSDINNAWLWAFLFWDRIIVLIVHHDIICNCENCRDIGDGGAGSA